MRNRYGNLIGGKYYYTQVEIGDNYPPTYINRALGTLTPNAPQTDTTFEYNSREGGMWGLSSTFEFPKRNNRAFTRPGLTPELDCVNDLTPFATWTQRTVNISRFANLSARVVLRISLLKDWTGNMNNTDAYIDFIQVSGTSYGFESTAESFETTTTNSYLTAYSSLSWTAMASTATRDRFSRANVVTATGTSSSNGNFGIRTNYIPSYSELPNHTMWLRSPVIALGASPTLSFRYWTDSSGDFIFTYLDLQ